MSEDKTLPLQEKEIQKQFMRLPILLVLGISAVAMYLEVLPKGMIGGMCFLLPLALILERIGAHTDLKELFGWSSSVTHLFGCRTGLQRHHPDHGGR